jgi:hypothetical protein
MQLPDPTMSDASFLQVAYPALSDFVANKDEVENWLKTSARVPHTVSNIQAAATASGSYVTLYRHPLNVCFEKISPSDDALKSRRQMRRENGYVISDCEIARNRLHDSLWGGTGERPKNLNVPLPANCTNITNKTLLAQRTASFARQNKTDACAVKTEPEPPRSGDCGDSHVPIGWCKACMDSFNDNGQSYLVKSKTACGTFAQTGLNTSILAKDDGTAPTSVMECAELCRKKYTGYVVDGEGQPDIFDKKNLKCEYFMYGAGTCQWVLKDMPPLYNSTTDTTTYQDLYGSQDKVPDLCTVSNGSIDIYRTVPEPLFSGYSDYCWNVCKDQWRDPCSSICTKTISDVFTKCSGCQGSENFCVSSSDNSPSAKQTWLEFNDTVYPPVSTKLVGAPVSCSVDANSNECVSYIVKYIKDNQNVPSGMGVYVDKASDAWLMSEMTTWAPNQCRPPLYNWWEKDKFLCKECQSVFDIFNRNEEAKMAQTVSLGSMWGASNRNPSGFCDYGVECKCPDGDMCDSVKIDLCFKATTPCQCTCRDALMRTPTVCSAPPLGDNTPVCNTAITNKCSIDQCFQWQNVNNEYSTDSRSLSLGGENSYIGGYCLPDGNPSTTCSDSLKNGDAKVKEDYVKRILIGCRLGASKTCVPDKYKFVDPTPPLVTQPPPPPPIQIAPADTTFFVTLAVTMPYSVATFDKDVQAKYKGAMAETCGSRAENVDILDIKAMRRQAESVRVNTKVRIFCMYIHKKIL